MTSSENAIPLVSDGHNENAFESAAKAKATFREANGDISMINESQTTRPHVNDVNYRNESATNSLHQEATSASYNNTAAAIVCSALDTEETILSDSPNSSNNNNLLGSVSPDKDRNDEEINFILAASLIEDARFGRTLDYKTDDTSLMYYRRYSKPVLQWATLAFMWFLLLLALFEDPAVYGAGLPYWATMIMELLCLAVIMFRMFQLSQFVPRKALITDPKNIAIALTIVVTLIDMVVYIGMIESPAAKNQAIRVSRVFRPLFFINMNESRQVRRAFRNIRNTIPEILNVLVLFFFSIAIFTLLAFKLFQSRDLVQRSGEPYFKDYWDSFFDLYVLVTTANSPDVMMPAYDESPWFSLFFIVYIIVNTYIFINMFLAVIYNSYRRNLQNEIRASVNDKRKKLEQAFAILKDTTGEVPVVTHATFVQVMNSMSKPPAFAKINLFWEVLNHSQEEESEDNIHLGIKEHEFLQVANLLNVYVVQDTTSVNLFIRLAPEVYLSRPSRFVRKCVDHKLFVYFFDVLIIANAICIGFDWESTEWFFLSVFILEIVLKIYTLGPREYFSFDRLWNWFDFIIIMAAFIATIIEASLDELYSFPREALDFLMVMRCLRLVKIVGTIDRFQIIVSTVLNIAPSLATYGVVLLMIYYAFAIVGMECFGGKIKFTDDDEELVNRCGNKALDGSEFLRIGYCNNNFNNILRSLVTLVELTVVNQWHIITLGYSLVTSKAARVYFIFFHLIVVILIMNIIVAFVLEAFILEYSLSRSHIESAVEKTIERLGLMANVNITDSNTDRTGLINDNDENEQYSGRPDSTHRQGPRHRFKINKGHKNVEVLLQRMFEGELEPESGATTAESNERILTLGGVTELNTAA